jgi:hypothetical protein
MAEQNKVADFMPPKTLNQMALIEFRIPGKMSEEGSISSSNPCSASPVALSSALKKSSTKAVLFGTITGHDR